MTDEIRNFTRIEVIKHHADLNKLHEHYYKLVRASPKGGWPALFNTDNYKRLCVRKDKMAKRFIDAVSKKFDLTHWVVKDIERIGQCIIWDEEKNIQTRLEKQQ